MHQSRPKQNDSIIQNMIMLILVASGMILLNISLRQSRYESFTESSSALIAVLASALLTGLIYWQLPGTLIDEPLRENTVLCGVGAVISGAFTLAAIFLEQKTDSFSLFGKTEIILWQLRIPKKYVFDLWSVVWFPSNLHVIFRAMRKERFKAKPVLWGCFAILGLTVEGILLFKSMPNIWQADLLVLNAAALAAAIWKFALSETNVKKGIAIGAAVCYGMLRLALLPLQCNRWGEGLTALFYSGDLQELASGTREIITKATFLGTSAELLHSESASAFLGNHMNPVLQLLYEGGWVAAIALLLALGCFLVMLLKSLGMENGRKHRNWLIFAAAAIMLLDRIVFGVIYSFGFPYPVRLPFMSAGGSVMDVMAFLLILFGAWENRTIQEFYRIETTFLPAEELLGKQNAYILLDKAGTPYSMDTPDDTVDVIAENGTISCNAEWYDFGRREFCVFTDNTAGSPKRFILEYVGGEWILPECSIQEEIRAQYLQENRPDCLEGEIIYADDEEED